MKNNKLSPWQIVGLTDSEGMFFAASYLKKGSVNIYYYMSIEFKITQMVSGTFITIKRNIWLWSCGN